MTGKAHKDAAQHIRTYGRETIRQAKGMRVNLPVNDLLRSMANKILPAKLQRKEAPITLQDVEALRDEWSAAYKEKRMYEFLRKIAEEKGRSVSWWRAAFKGEARFDIPKNRPLKIKRTV